MDNKAMLSVEKLETELLKIIKSQYDNLELKKLLSKKFADKGLNPATVTLVMNEKKYINQLNDYEKITLAYGCYEVFSSNKYLNPEMYYSDRVVSSYNNYIVEYEKNDAIELKNFQMKNEFEYYGLIPYKKIFDMMSNNLLDYVIDIQRSPTYKTLGKITVPMPTVDNDTVLKIEKAILDDDFEDTQIVLSLLIDENGEYPKFSFEEKLENIGDIVIDDHLIINDGMHRCLAICNAVVKHYQEKKTYLDGAISARIVICDKARAKKITSQSFKKALTNVSWLKAIDENDVNRFVDRFIGLSSTLKDNIGMTFEEAKALNKLTYKTLIIDLVNKLGIEVNNKSEVLIRSKKMANCLDTLIDLLKDNNATNKDIYGVNMWAAYIWFAYEMSNREEDIDLYEKMIDRVLNMSEVDSKNLKLSLKNYSMNNIINYFRDVFEVK